MKTAAARNQRKAAANRTLPGPIRRVNLQNAVQICQFGRVWSQAGWHVDARVASQTAPGRVGRHDEGGAILASLLGDQHRWIACKRIKASGGMDVQGRALAPGRSAASAAAALVTAAQDRVDFGVRDEAAVVGGVVEPRWVRTSRDRGGFWGLGTVRLWTSNGWGT